MLLTSLDEATPLVFKNNLRINIGSKSEKLRILRLGKSYPFLQKEGRERRIIEIVLMTVVVIIMMCVWH